MYEQISNNEMTELGEKIFLDRYALKDGSRKSIREGSLVIVAIDKNQREVGIVERIDSQVHVVLRDGTSVSTDLTKVDVLLETNIRQLQQRVAKGAAAVEKDSAKYTKVFADLLEDWKFVPGGRILAACGTDQQLTFFNCMPPDQEVLTDKGYIPISDIVTGDLVVTHKNRLRPVTNIFSRHTSEPMYTVSVQKLGFDPLRLTGDHKVFVLPKGESVPVWKETFLLKPGDFLCVGYQANENNENNVYLDSKFILDVSSHLSTYPSRVKKKFNLPDKVVITEDLCYFFGCWLGDGCITHRSGSKIPSGVKLTFNLRDYKRALVLQKIVESTFCVKSSLLMSSTKRWYDLYINSMELGILFKELFGCYSWGKSIPKIFDNLPNSMLFSLIKGIFQTDGYCTPTSMGVLLANKTLCVQLHQFLLRMGYCFSFRENTHVLAKHASYRLSASVNTYPSLTKDFYDKEIPFTISSTSKPGHALLDTNFWVPITKIQVDHYEGIVHDIEVEEDHSFISAGIVVSNCYVIGSPEDSRTGIMKTLTEMTEIMSRGGGVGINLSSLRPQGAYVKGVNGRSSGAASWAALYSQTTGLIEQGGCFAPYVKILTDKGHVEIKELVERIEAEEKFNAWTPKGWKPITDKFRNGVKPVFRVTTQAGLTVDTTEDHKFMTYDEKGDFVLKPLKELTVGSNVLRLLGPENEQDQRSEVHTMSEELAFILGYWMANGSYDYDRTLTFSVPLDRPDTKETLIKFFKAEFGYDLKVRNGDGACEIVYKQSVDLVKQFKELGYVKPAHVPKELFKQPASTQKAFIGGWFAGDGCNRGTKGGLGIDCIELDALQDIQLLLQGLGISSNISTQFRSEPNWKPLYRLSVTGHWATTKLMHWLKDWSSKCFDRKLSTKDQSFTWPSQHNHFKHFMEGKTLTKWHRVNPANNANTSRKGVGYLKDHVSEFPAYLQERVTLLDTTVLDSIVDISPVGEMETFDITVDEAHLMVADGVLTSNSRRGALMLILSIWHPDVIEFISCKRKAGHITNANISVAITDDFMEAVKKDQDWDLIFPDTQDPQYHLWTGSMNKWERDRTLPNKVYKTVRARDLWNSIIESAHASAEPGVWFIDRSNKDGNGYFYPEGELIATNPCQPYSAPVLTPKGIKLFGTLQAGDTIWSGKEWTKVTKIWSNGVKPVYRYLTSYGSFTGTEEHRVVCRGFKIRVGRTDRIDVSRGNLNSTARRKGRFKKQDILEGFTLEYALPSSRVYLGSPSTMCGFLRGLYDNKGKISANQILLENIEFPTISYIQVMLSALGIISYWTDDGYWNRRSYVLHIDDTLSCVNFRDKIGFSQKEIQKKLKAVCDSKSYNPPLNSTILETLYLGEEEVFDITVEHDDHTYWTAGLLVSNCGEQPLPKDSVCLLGHMNLSQYVNEEGTDIKWKALGEDVTSAVRFLDNVIETTPYFDPNHERQQKGERRVGLGTLGLAEALIKLGLRYGPESTEFIHRLYKFIMVTAYIASFELAKEKGPFSWYSPQMFENGTFANRALDLIAEFGYDVKSAVKTGIRNVTLITQAPVGSTGTMVNTSTGIEPFFSWSFFRKGRLGIHEEKVKVVQEWMNANPGKELPAYFVNAMELSPEDHVKVQATIQKYTDSAISKTCNCPSDFTIEQTRELYELMYDLGCKGGTIYRDQSRDEQVLNLKKDEPSVLEPVKQSEPNSTMKKLPKRRLGSTVSQNTPLGNAHITMNYAEGEPLEVFVDVGKTGSDIKAYSEALGRLISLTLRLPSALSSKARVEAIVDQLEGIGGQRSVGLGPNKVLSLPDAVAKVLRAEFLEDRTTSSVVLDQPKPYKIQADLCPKCGNVSLVRSEGCKHCDICGHSEC